MPTAEAVFIDLLKVDTKKKNPCWEGYEQVGFKMKNGRRVPNCVPIKRSRKASDLATPRKADELAKVKDDEGHEHGADGRFVSSGGAEYTHVKSGPKTTIHDSNGDEIGHVKSAGGRSSAGYSHFGYIKGGGSVPVSQNHSSDKAGSDAAKQATMRSVAEMHEAKHGILTHDKYGSPDGPHVSVDVSSVPKTHFSGPLWHTTSKDSAASIVSGGFNSKGSNGGKYFGPGTYFYRDSASPATAYGDTVVQADYSDVPLADLESRELQNLQFDAFDKIKAKHPDLPVEEIKNAAKESVANSLIDAGYDGIQLGAETIIFDGSKKPSSTKIVDGGVEKNVKDDEGHEHGNDGRFVSTGGSSSTRVADDVAIAQAEHEKLYGKKAGLKETECYRCGGSGTTPFRHIENGDCFHCGGSGRMTIRIEQPKVIAARLERERKRDESRLSERLLKEYEVSQRHPELYAKLSERAHQEVEAFHEGGRAMLTLHAFIDGKISEEKVRRELRVSEQHLVEHGAITPDEITEKIRDSRGFPRSEADLNSRFVGRVGEKITGHKLTLERPPIRYENAYGGGYICILRDEDGNSIKWFTSNPHNVFSEGRLEGVDKGEIPVGSSFEADFIVKDHRTRDGVEETHIKNLKPTKQKKTKKMLDAIEQSDAHYDDGDEIRKLKDDEGHEHGSDGRFVSTGGSSGSSLIPPEPNSNHDYSAWFSAAKEHASKLDVDQLHAVVTDPSLRENKTRHWPTCFKVKCEERLRQIGVDRGLIPPYERNPRGVYQKIDDMTQEQRSELYDNLMRYAPTDQYLTWGSARHYLGEKYGFGPQLDKEPATQFLRDKYAGVEPSRESYERGLAGITAISEGKEKPEDISDNEWSELVSSWKVNREKAQEDWDKRYPDGGKLFRGLNTSVAAKFMKENCEEGKLIEFSRPSSSSDDPSFAAMFVGDAVKDRDGEYQSPGGILLTLEGVKGEDLDQSYHATPDAFRQDVVSTPDQEILLKSPRKWKVKEYHIAPSGWGSHATLVPADDVRKLKDSSGHEHGEDGRFVGAGDGSSKRRREPKNEREENLLKHVQQMAKYGKLIGMPPEHAAFYQRLADEGEWFDPKELPREIPEGEHKMCFMNSFQNAQYRDKDYVEGIAHGIIPLHHAWNAEPGSNDAMDSTWQSHNDAESLVPTKDAAYLGIRVPHEERMKAALKHGTYGVYLKDTPPPKKKRVKKSGTPLKNVPADWKNQYEMYPNERHDPVARNRTYPLDGRQTIWPPYEMYMPTRTAGEILDAVKAVGQDRSLPDDFADYLRQRVPSFEALKSVDPSTKIDLCGKMVSHDSE